MKNRIIALALLLAGFLPACGGEKPAEVPLVRPVRAVQLGDAAQLVGRWFPGRAKATQEVEIAFEVQGKLIERPVDVGTVVEKGDLLAALDPRDYNNAVSAAQAALDQASAQRERMELAAKTNAVSRQDVDDAVARHEVAIANLAVKEKALDDSRIVAPFAGVVTATYVENFQNVRMKQKVLRLVDNSRVEMVLQIPEANISNASRVLELHCRFDAFPGQQIPAELKEVGKEASETTRTYPVTLIMDQPAGFEILPGMTGEAAATKVEQQAAAAGDFFVVPVASLLHGEDDKDYVWVVDEAGGSIRKQEVTRGQLTSFGLQIAGVQKGQWIATAGAHYLREGQRVRLFDQASAE